MDDFGNSYSSGQYPSFADLFPGAIKGTCASDGPESNEGVFAYLVDLYTHALQLKTNQTDKDIAALSLADRRPDLADTVLNESGLHEPVPTLDLLIELLERKAREFTNSDQSLDHALAQATYPTTLPWHRPLQQTLAALKYKRIAFFDLLQQSDYEYPNFCHGRLRTEHLRTSMMLSNGLSPEVEALLLDKLAMANEDYFLKYFGMTVTLPDAETEQTEKQRNDARNAEALMRLSDPDTLARHLGLTRQQLFHLLACEVERSSSEKGANTYAQCSAHMPKPQVITPAIYGAQYVNSGSAPPMTVCAESTTNTRQAAGRPRITDLTLERLDGIRKIAHLQQALGLPFAQLDWLLVAAMRAEGQSKNFVLTQNTLRALGVFGHLRREYRVTADQFAALLGYPCPYANRGDQSFLDELLKTRGAASPVTQPLLLLDGEAFEPDDEALNNSGQSGRSTLAGFSVALDLPEALTQALLNQLTQLGFTCTRSLTTVAALYRLAWLPRLAGRTALQGSALLHMLAASDEKVMKQIAGNATILEGDDAVGILDVVVAFINLSHWLKRKEIDPLKLLPCLQEGIQLPESWENLRRQLNTNVLETAESISGESSKRLVAGACGLLKLDPLYVPELLNWIAAKPADLLATTEAAQQLWLKLYQYGTAIRLLKLSPEGLRLFTGNHSWFDIQIKHATGGNETKPVIPPLNLEVCYQLGAYQEFIDQVTSAGHTESELINLLKNTYSPPENFTTQVTHRTVAELIGWQPTEIADALRSARAKGTKSAGASSSASAPDERPLNISDLDFILRLFRNSTTTDLSVKSLTTLAALNNATQFSTFQGIAQILLNSCSSQHDDLPATLHATLNESWRDALLQWVSSQLSKNNKKPPASRTEYAQEFSAYFLTDVSVTGQVKTNRIEFAISALQYYLSRVYSFLEQGHSSSEALSSGANVWQMHLSQFRYWQQRKSNINHPENLLNPEQRPDKSEMFKTLQNELSQGRLTSDAINTAITSYLTSFETIANLQVLTGYLDGDDWTNGTYHFIGKTNDEPFEYYWRSLEMNQRFEEGYPIPQAWSEWEKINVAWGGELIETPAKYKDNTATTVDAIRPVIIAGRQYVVWVERDRNALPNPDKNVLTPTQFHRVSVCYAYKQSDGIWSPANELIRLDGTAVDEVVYLDEIQRAGNTSDLTLKDKSYTPHLIAVADASKWANENPYLLVALGAETDGHIFFQTRDLLFLDKLDPISTHKRTQVELVTSLRNSFSNPLKLQNSVNALAINFKTTSFDGPLALPKEVTARVDTTKPASLPWQGRSKWDELIRATLQRETARPITLAQLDAFERFMVNGTQDSSSLTDPRLKTCLFPHDDKKTNRLYKKIDSEEEDRTKSDKALRSSIYVSNIYGARYKKLSPPKQSCHTRFRPLDKPAMNLVITSSKFSNNQIMTSIAGQYFLELTKRKDGYTYKTLNMIERETYQEVTNANEKRLTILQDDHLQIILPKGEARPLSGSIAKRFRVTTEDENYLRIENYFLSVGQNVFTVELLAVADYAPIVTHTYFKDPIPAESISISLAVKTPQAETYTILITKNIIADGTAEIKIDSYPFKENGAYTFVMYETNNPDNNVAISVEAQLTQLNSPNLIIDRNPQQAQVLCLPENESGRPNEDKLSLKNLRLNTLFGKQLVSRATQSPEAVLAWDTQHLEEPSLDGDASKEILDFQGANGRYFLELFLHLPAFIADRLSTELQFREAQQWYTRHLFDPFEQPDWAVNTLSPANPTDSNDVMTRPANWRARPLKSGTPAQLSEAAAEALDTIGQAFSDPEAYRRSLVIALLEHWVREGDSFYRQLTLGALNQAWLRYQQAEMLLGSLPIPEHSNWQSITLRQAAATLPFKKSLNPRLTRLKNTLEQRFFNLRNALTLNGKPLPKNLLAPANGTVKETDWGRTATGLQNGTATAQVPTFRFSQMIAHAVAAARQLSDLGKQLLTITEHEDDTAFGQLQQTNLLKLAQFTVDLQSEALRVARLEKRNLEIAREACDYRLKHYGDLIAEGRSVREILAYAMSVGAGMLEAATAPIETVAGVADSLPNIFGTSVGGAKWSGAVKGVIAGMKAYEITLAYAADRELTEAEYDRRAQEWELERSLAEFEMNQADNLLLQQDIQIRAAQIEKNLADATRDAVREELEDMTSGFLNTDNYGTMVRHITSAYTKAHDAVQALCSSTEAAWRYETGDYNTLFEYNAWNNDIRGLFAAEPLLNELQRMQDLYLYTQERKLNIRKTFSLSTLLGKDSAGLRKLLSAPVVFRLRSRDFDSHYPGHYLRQVKHISVSLKLEESVDAPTEIAATLTQTSSRVLVTADPTGLADLYSETPGTSPHVVTNLRANQQIALSSITRDDGRAVGTENWICQLMFDDGRYLPFEGTGVDSDWTLSISEASLSSELKNRLSDIEIHLVYTARDGGVELMEKAKEKLAGKP